MSNQPAHSSSRDSRGLIERAALGLRVWLTRCRYRSLLDAEVAESLQLAVDQNHNGHVGDAPRRLAGAVLRDFQPSLHESVLQLGEGLQAAVNLSAGNALSEIRSEVDYNVRIVDNLQAEVVDSRNLATATADLESPANSPATGAELIQSQKDLVHHRATRLHLTLLGYLSAAVASLTTGAEGTLVYLSLLAVFEGVIGVSIWMLRVQAVVITFSLLFLAHKSRRHVTSNTDWLWLSRACLVVVALALAALRAGVVSVGSSGADGRSAGLEVWGLLLTVFLVSIVLAALGAEAYEQAFAHFRRAHALWNDPQVNLGALEGAVAAADAEQRRTAQQRREIHHRLVERTRSLEAELRTRHRDMRSALHREMRRAQRRLAPVVNNAAWQLARLKHDGKGSTSDGSQLREFVLPLLALGIGLFGVSCEGAQILTLNRAVLLDTSGSMPADLASLIRADVLHDVRDWVALAPSGSSFTIWWLTPAEAAYPAERLTLTVPPLQVPANEYRQHLARGFFGQVSALFNQLPRDVQRTRLLESLFFIGSVASSPWGLTVYSDLQEDSRAWDAVSGRVRDDDDASIVSAMLTVCPAVRSPPADVELRSWPGLLSRGRAGLREHQHYEALFKAFFAQWAPGTSVREDAI